MKQSNGILTKVEQNMFNLYRTVIIILFICGYNFKTFSTSLLSKVLAQLYSISLAIIISYSTFTCCFLNNFSQFWSLIEYDLSVIILMIYNSKVIKFISNLSHLDIYLRINKRHYKVVRNRAFILIVTLWIIRIGYTTLHCFSFNCFHNFGLFLINSLSSFALDMNRVWRFIILDTIRYRIKLLRVRLEEMPDCDYYLYVKDMKSMKEDKISFCLRLYRDIADLLDLILPELHAQIFVSIICGVPKLIYDVYNALLVIEGLKPYSLLAFSIMHIVHVSFLLLSPSFVIEFFGVELDRIKLYLIHRIIDNKDPKYKEDAQLFLQYTNIRPFSRKIWRSIPVNIALPLEILNICYSAIIVIVNFTHLYG